MKGDPSFIVSPPMTVRIAGGTKATTFTLDLTERCIDVSTHQRATSSVAARLKWAWTDD